MGTIERIFEDAEREAEKGPKDVQVGDGVVFGTNSMVHRVVGVHMYGDYVAAVSPDDVLPYIWHIDDITRIVTRATPQVKDTVEGTLDGITKHGFVYESPQIGGPMVKWDNGHYDYLSVVAPRLRIVHRPERSE